METGAPQLYEHVSGKAPQLYEHVSDKAPQLHYLDESSSAAGSAAYLEHLEETRAIKVCTFYTAYLQRSF